MSELRAVLIVIGLLVLSDLVWLRKGGAGPREWLWLLFITAVGGLGWVVFDHSPAFFPWLPAMFAVNEVRLRFGLLYPGTLGLEPYRYVPPMLVQVTTGNGELALWLAALLSVNAVTIRAVLLALSDSFVPIGLSRLDVDHLVPPPIRIRRERRGNRQGGFTMVEAIVGLTLIAVVSSGLFLAASGRAARLVQVREAAAAREAAVSVLERAGVWEFDELLAADGREFPVPGDGRPGRIGVETLEPGVARVTVTAPRRNGAPIELVTLRSRGEP